MQSPVPNTPVSPAFDDVKPCDRRYFNHPIPAESLCDVLNVSASDLPHLRVFDQENTAEGVPRLLLIHYLSAKVDNSELMERVGHVRGLVVDVSGENPCVVRGTSGYNSDVVVDSLESVSDIDFSTSTFEVAPEGTVVFAWYDQSHPKGPQWRTSTFKKLDAHNSRWNSMSVGELFTEIRQFSLDNLDQSKCYMFLMQHTRNKLVWPVTKNKLLLFKAFFVNPDSDCPSTYLLPALEGVDLPEPVTFESAEQFYDAVDSLDRNSDCVGYYLTKSESAGPFPVKYINARYSKMCHLRGSAASIENRYTKLWNHPDVALFVENYPEYKDRFAQADYDIDQMIDMLYKMYVDRHIKKNWYNIPKCLHIFVEKCHAFYNEDRKTNKINRSVVENMLRTRTPGRYILQMRNVVLNGAQ